VPPCYSMGKLLGRKACFAPISNSTPGTLGRCLGFSRLWKSSRKAPTWKKCEENSRLLGKTRTCRLKLETSRLMLP
jgi:hypothetical protein